jgi:amino acid adenylation domain-containing protein/thioester reductase-like protein
MKTLEEFLSHLDNLDIKIWCHGNALRYNAPENALTPELLAQMRERKTEILGFLRANPSWNATNLEPIGPLSRENNVFPLSFAQQRLWFLNQLEGTSATYYVYTALRFEGRLQRSALEQSLQEIVQRHETLRTTFSRLNGKPVQVIHPMSHYPLPLSDLQALPSEKQTTEVQRLINEETRCPFDLSTGPLFRYRLFQLGPETHVLVLNMHHIISDEWSIDIFIHEWGALYKAFSIGQPSPLPSLPIQYVDFAHWQRQWLTEEVLEQQANYWKQQLAGAPALLSLPTDHPRPPVQRFQGRTLSFVLKQELTAQLKHLSQQTGTTLFMTLLSAFATLLSRYTGQTDIVIGSPIANRTHSQTESLIGFFVNTLVLRLNLVDNPPFEDVLLNTRQVALEAYSHQDIPFEEVVKALQPERNLSHNPLFQVMFILVNAPIANVELAGLSLTSLEIESVVAEFDLTLSIEEKNDGLVSQLEYNTDLFERATIERLSGHLQTLLTSIVENPHKPIHELPLLTAAEQQQLLAWNDTASDYPQALCIHQLFEAQVEKTPDAVALVFEDQQLSYKELNNKANQLAHYLQSLGVKPEVLVGICMARSLEMVIALMGILKAGGAYLPLDPAYPAERLAFMLEDAQISVLLTQSSLKNALPETKAQVVCLDTKPLSHLSTANPFCSVKTDNLVYVIYTSGSTGKPKGVMIQHQSLVNFVHTDITKYKLTQDDRLLQFHSISFDAAAEEIYACLGAGGTLVLRFDDMLNSISRFLQYCQDLGLTVLHLPTAFWHQLTSELGTGKVTLPDSVRLVTIGGEHALSESVDLWQQWVGTTPLVNVYGPTETTVGPTNYPLPSLIPRKWRDIPIGGPIPNVQTYILDKYLQTVPIGIAGELYIGGVCLARGYLNRPDLTVQKFIPNPFSNHSRLYKTGDLARYLPDGNIEYLGRIDNQVKMRGFRIELGEIEAVLAQHPAVSENVVMMTGERGLVAYWVPKPEIELWSCHADYCIFDEIMYYAMTHDELRNKRYQEAINQAVKNKVVVDIGTGKDVALSKFCVNAGAKKIYAIEMQETAYQQAKEYVKSLGLEDKIILIHGDSTQVTLPEKVDVCVSEIIGAIGSSEGALPLLNDARRFLKPEGIMIPEKCLTMIAAVYLPESLAEHPQLLELSKDYARHIFEKVGRKIDFRVVIKNFPSSHLLSNVAVFEELDFTKPIAVESERKIHLTLQQSGKIDGFLLWLNLYTLQGVVPIDTLNHVHSWLPVYFPVFYPGIEVKAGDRIEAICSSRTSENGLNPDYSIKGCVWCQDGRQIDFEYESLLYSQGFKSNAFYDKLFSESPVAPPSSTSEPSIKAYLEERLPNYMVPSTFLKLEALPFTPNDKIDYQALSQWSENRDFSSYVAPRTPEEKRMAAIWAEVLGVEQIGVHDNFFELGGHSLLATQLMSRIHETFLVELPLRHLFGAPTVAGIINLIHQGGTDTVLDFNAEAVLSLKIQPPTIAAVDGFTKPHSIFLTGATGFLGTYLLYELLVQTTADIYCLVRSANADEGKKRLQSKLESYALWHDNFKTRIFPVTGELSQPRLGLSDSFFKYLASRIDVIYHNGAMVNFVYPYSKLKATNVLGTQEVLKLACQIKAKPVHFVSTVSVFSSNSGVKIIRESDIGDIQALDEGYSQSKWVAEKLVMLAGERGLPVCIYRPSRITGHSQTGLSNKDDFLSIGIKGCIQLGLLPALDDQEDNMVPVDYVSRAIVYLSQQTDLLGKTFHLVNPRSILMGELFNWLRSLGYRLEQTSYAQWRSELSRHEENALYPLLSSFPQEDFESIKDPEFDCQNTIEGLTGTDIVCPPVDTKLLDLYFSDFRKCGFLEAPSMG